MSSPSQRGALPKSGGGVTVPDGGGPLCRGKGGKKELTRAVCAATACHYISEVKSRIIHI